MKIFLKILFIYIITSFVPFSIGGLYASWPVAILFPIFMTIGLKFVKKDLFFLGLYTGILSIFITSILFYMFHRQHEFLDILTFQFEFAYIPILLSSILINWMEIE